MNKNEKLEKRPEFLRRKLNNKENIYKHSFLSDKGGLIDIYKTKYYAPFLFGNFIKASAEDFNVAYNDKEIMKVTTQKKLIINNINLFIFCIAGMSNIRIESLKVHITENYLRNWNTVEVFKDSLTSGSFSDDDIISVFTISGDEVVRNGFGRAGYTDDQLTADIQFITLESKSEEYLKGQYAKELKAHINRRFHFGLITIILYKDKISNIGGISFINDIEADAIIDEVGLTKEEMIEAAKNKQPANEVVKNEESEDNDNSPQIINDGGKSFTDVIF